ISNAIMPPALHPASEYGPSGCTRTISAINLVAIPYTPHLYFSGSFKYGDHSPRTAQSGAILPISVYDVALPLPSGTIHSVRVAADTPCSITDRATHLG